MPISDAAAQWEGWGTALKPAWEPIALARKPLIGSVAANVLAHGTGALNIDGCRAHAEDAPGGAYVIKRFKPGATLAKTGGVWKPEEGAVAYHGALKPGRWPANVLHDGSDEVIALFPQEGGESAARFFYSGKADAEDRFGSRHPTVKPVDLMRWLVRLVTPPGGTVLDLFAGSGTTGAAALAEGMCAILIEREAAYVEDIRRRIAYAQGLGDHSAAIKARRKAPVSAGPLFEGGGS